MQVKIVENYSPQELEHIINELIKSEIITDNNIEFLEKIIRKSKYNFLTINSILTPSLHSFAYYSSDDEDVLYAYNSEEKYVDFYSSLTIKLMEKCNFNKPWSFSVEYTGERESYYLKINTPFFEKEYTIDSFFQYHTKIVPVLNESLNCNYIEKCYIGFEIDNVVLFVIMKNVDYSHLLKERILYFPNVEYPEVEEWKKRVDNNPLPF
jgi:hypothetical protein